MLWKMFAVVAIAMAFTATAQAECGGDHGKTAANEISTPSKTDTLAASGTGAETAIHEHAARE